MCGGCGFRVQQQRASQHCEPRAAAASSEQLQWARLRRAASLGLDVHLFVRALPVWLYIYIIYIVYNHLI
eukprot:scaffold17096_cov112-Isochrysis_galbana.AAC.2